MTAASARPRKSPLLILLTAATWLALTWLSWRVFQGSAEAGAGPAGWSLLPLLHAAWILVWLWAIHTLWHQLASAVLPRRRLPRGPARPEVPVAVLYLTCDDFDPVACGSCLEQDHRRLRLIVCDDSRKPESRQAIDAWVAACGHAVTVCRRGHRRGFKAGNLNHAIATSVGEEHIVVCDADEIIPADFVSRLLACFTGPEIAFVQASHEARGDCATRFSAVLGPTVKLFHDYTLAMRNRFGFVACFGHGVMIRRSAWQRVGGFPEIVAEDLGFASRCLAVGLRGLHASDVVAREAFPPNYRAFIAKYAKIAGGTVEYFQKEFPALLRSRRASLVEIADILLTFSFCIGGLATLLNVLGALSLSLIYDLHDQGQVALWIVAIWLFGTLTPLVALVVELCRKPAQALRYLLTATVAYVSLVPILAARVLTQGLVGRPAGFEVTGAVAAQPDPIARYLAIGLSGAAILVATLALRSPAFVPLLFFSLILISGPLMALSERDGALGLIGRNCSFLPFLALAGVLGWGG